MKGYLKTKEAAEYISTSEGFLKGRMHTMFLEKVHFFKPKRTRLTRWSIDALDMWMMGKDDEKMSEENNLILDQLLN